MSPQIEAQARLPVRNVDVDGVFVVQQAAHISHGRVQQALALVQAALLGRAGQRARVWQRTNLGNLRPSALPLSHMLDVQGVWGLQQGRKQGITAACGDNLEYANGHVDDELAHTAAYSNIIPSANNTRTQHTVRSKPYHPSTKLRPAPQSHQQG